MLKTRRECIALPSAKDKEGAIVRCSSLPLGKPPTDIMGHVS